MQHHTKEELANMKRSYNRKIMREIKHSPDLLENVLGTDYNHNVISIRSAKKYANREVLKPKNQKQAQYLNLLRTMEQIIVTGCAGTGKTYMSTAFAADLLLDNKIEKIVLSRPNIASGRSIGFFPGSLEEKMAPWVVPFTSVLIERMGKGAYECAIKNGKIEIIPFEVMRGRTFDNAFIILDEGQNTTPTEMKMFLTRVGENSKVVINGDVAQSDLSNSSGLSQILMMVNRFGIPAGVIEFDENDVVRSGICGMWIKAFNRL